MTPCPRDYHGLSVEERAMMAGYYSPGGDLVFYYGEVGFYNGIVRVGEFEGGMEAIERQSDDFSVRIERAG